jgi:hypothetical protein
MKTSGHPIGWTIVNSLLFGQAGGSVERCRSSSSILVVTAGATRPLDERTRNEMEQSIEVARRQIADLRGCQRRRGP